MRNYFSSVLVGLALAGAMAPGPSQAISYGILDCDSVSCDHPNVVILSGLRAAGNGTLATCSGTLIHRTSSYYVFLTAAHCAKSWRDSINSGFISSVGVSFLSSVTRLPFNGFDQADYAAGGVPVRHPDFGPQDGNGWIQKHDLGMVSFTAAAVEAMFPEATTIPLTVLAGDVNLKLQNLVSATTKPQKNLFFYSVGYGRDEYLDSGTQGDGSNEGGWNDLGMLGTRRVADRQSFDNLRESILQTSQNPALGNNGTCDGDSGGPTFYQTLQGPVQVGATSSGDLVCRATGTYARLDIAAAKSFINCGRNFPSNIQRCGN